MPPTDLRDRPVMGWSIAGLAHPGIKAEVADELLGAGEARHFADGGDQPDRNGQIDAGDGHQATGAIVGEAGLGQRLVAPGKLSLQAVELGEPYLNGLPLVAVQRLLRQPGTPAATEDVALIRWQQVGAQHRMDAVLETRARLHDGGASGDGTAQPLREAAGAKDEHRLAEAAPRAA